jgi:hypothetical protein
MRLVVICDRKGVPAGDDLVDPKIGQERESALRLATAHWGTLLFADGGFWSAEYQRTMQLIDIQLINPAQHKLGQRPASEIARPASG